MNLFPTSFTLSNFQIFKLFSQIFKLVMMKANELKQIVKEKYGKIVEQTSDDNSCCCGLIMLRTGNFLYDFLVIIMVKRMVIWLMPI